MKYFVTSKISENIHETPEGFLVCVGVSIARTGEMIYSEDESPLEGDDDGIVRVHRDETEVFRPETLASFEGKPVTISHPNEFVSPQNWSAFAKGIMQNVRRGEGEAKDDLVADLLITDSVAIALVKNGLREVSCGYEADWEQTEEGKGTHKNIIGNHLALVQKGRAGAAYAINDHDGKNKKGNQMKLSDKIKAIFAKAQDEALKVADAEGEGEKEAKKEESKDAGAYDELVKIVKDLSAKLDGMGKAKDDAANPAAGEKEEKAKDEDPPAAEENAMEARLAKLESLVEKLLEGQAVASEDEDMEEEEAEDDDFEESTMVGDTASRVEILAPGLKAKAKDAKAAALKVAYATKDGKAMIDKLTGGKAPAYDSAEKVDALFIAASELLKASRQSDLSKTKQVRDMDFGQSAGPMSAERMNEINAKHYGKGA